MMIRGAGHECLFLNTYFASMTPRSQTVTGENWAAVPSLRWAPLPAQLSMEGKNSNQNTNKMTRLDPAAPGLSIFSRLLQFGVFPFAVNYIFP